MLTLLAARNKPSAVFKAVADEFKVPIETVRRDYYNMTDWLHVVEQEEQAAAIAVEGMDIGVRIATDLLLGIQPTRPGAQLTIKQSFLKIQALHVYIKANVEDLKFKQSIGQITRKPEEIISHDFSIGMPFACDPEIKKVLLENAEEQRKQKELRDKKRSEDAAKNSKAEPSTGT
jgi:hypothetical protein